MQADGLLPAAKRRNYSGVGAALSTIIKEEGVAGLFTGAGPTAVRAMALNMGMLASNDQAKEALQAAGVTGLPQVFGASAIAGFFASFFSLPFDYVKTQLQKMQPLPDGSMPYKGALDCASKTMASGGPLKFYTGCGMRVCLGLVRSLTRAKVPDVLRAHRAARYDHAAAAGLSGGVGEEERVLSTENG